VVELTERRYMRPSVSCTFEGRDRFAPAAAWLANDVELSQFGPAVTTWRKLPIPEPVTNDETIVAEVLLVDRFGNLITNVDRHTFERFSGEGPLEVTIGEHAVGTIVSTYSDAHRGTVCALFGSSDHLEVAVNGGSAAQALQLGRGARIVISRSDRSDRSC
jgi:S-adenosylmethionine hydrolase